MLYKNNKIEALEHHEDSFSKDGCISNESTQFGTENLGKTTSNSWTRSSRVRFSTSNLSVVTERDNESLSDDVSSG